MKMRTVAVGLMVSALALSACGREGAPATPESEATAGLSYPVGENVALEGSPTFDAMTTAGRVTIGVKEDQPGLGFRDATTNEYSGFDVEIARMVAASLGFGPDQIDYVPIPSAAREDSIERGDVDYYVGTYTINDGRKERISFAGPYFQAGQSILVRADETEITGMDTLKGKKVCSVTGSTPIKRVAEMALTEPENIVEFQTYTQCVDQLTTNQVDAVTTDDAILAGYAAQQPEELKVVGEPFSEEPYGIGIALDDTVLRGAINDALQASYDDNTWQEIYDATLGLSGTTAEPPTIDRY